MQAPAAAAPAPPAASAPASGPRPVDPGNALRARIHYMVAQNNAMVIQAQFADAKAAALLTLAGLAALRGPLPEGPLLADLLGVALHALLAATILLCLWAVMPRYPSIRAGNGAGDRFTWTGLIRDDWSAEAHVDFAREGGFDELLRAVALSNHGASRVLLRKFRIMRVAFLFAIAAVVLMILQTVV